MSFRLFFISLLFLGGPIAAHEPIIQNVNMAPVNPDTYGLSSQGQGALPLSIWEGLSFEHIQRLLASLPKTQKDPILLGLQKKLLTAATKIPESAPENIGKILKTRIAHLIQLWEIEKAHDLAQRHPEVLGENAWMWLQFSHYLALENHSKALEIVKNALLKDGQNPQWSRAMIGLQLLKGQKEQALLGISLLEETPNEETTAFLNMAKKIAHTLPLEEDFIPSDVLEFKLWLKATKKNLLTLPHHFLSLALLDTSYQSLDPKDQLWLAEKAFSTGTLSLETLQNLYQVHGSPKQSGVEKDSADQTITLPPVPLDWEKNDPRTRAELYVKIQTTQGDEQLSHILKAAQHLSKHQHTILAPLFMKDFKTLPREERFKDLAPLLAEVLLQHGEMDTALEWLSLMTLEQKASIAPLILIRVNTLSLEAKQNLFSFWYDAHGKDFKKAPVILGIFEALIPDITDNRAFFSDPSYQTQPLEVASILWQALLAPHHPKGLSLVLLLKLSCNATEKDTALIPLILKLLKRLECHETAHSLALKCITTYTHE